LAGAHIIYNISNPVFTQRPFRPAAKDAKECNYN
jgi:hypothetical protein